MSPNDPRWAEVEMATRYRTHDRSTANRAVPAGGEICQVGRYLTDEVFLYRVTGSVARGAEAVIELEDCYSLDVVAVPMSDLRARRLRVVTPLTRDD